MSPLTELIGGAKVYGWGNLLAAGAFESIASTTLGSNSNSVVFSSIPGTYQSLQIRIFAKHNSSSTQTADMSINEDIGVSSTYASHRLRGTGAAAQAAAIAPSYSWIEFGILEATQSGAFIIDIHDYASTTRNKTIRSFWGFDLNGSGQVGMHSGFKNNTAAITSIKLYVNQGSGVDWASGSVFSLYGIKGA